MLDDASHDGKRNPAPAHGVKAENRMFAAAGPQPSGIPSVVVAVAVEHCCSPAHAQGTLGVVLLACLATVGPGCLGVTAGLSPRPARGRRRANRMTAACGLAANVVMSHEPAGPVVRGPRRGRGTHPRFPRASETVVCRAISPSSAGCEPGGQVHDVHSRPSSGCGVTCLGAGLVVMSAQREHADGAGQAEESPAGDAVAPDPQARAIEVLVGVWPAVRRESGSSAGQASSACFTAASIPTNPAPNGPTTGGRQDELGELDRKDRSHPAA
jgi:hypothetical protein